ncbi:MAG TPA: gliding motility-associated C-terminal domain-containing protein [Chitinophagaceae bacterium]|nr:gliding motility-associated C-terminal domain-containing protein [Chitinophagaceae bacterium]
MMKTFAAIFFLLFSFQWLQAQDKCTALGQTPETAFPVCGNSVFKQVSVPTCINSALTVPGCSGDGAAYGDKNPFWYKFTCFKGGSLEFLIKPNDQGDDYDWQLYDITGHAPGDVYKDPKLIVAANWAGTYGNTGTTKSGVDYTQCASDPNAKEPSFAKDPILKEGHQYLLLVSHFTDSQSGYGLSFGGGTAVITDTTAPRLKSAAPGCDGSTIAVQLNKKVQCKSLAADGSDFTITPAAAKVIAASSTDCSRGFDMDSLSLTLDQPLPPGKYTLTIQNGTDHNTLLDNCENGIPQGDTLVFTVRAIAPTPMDSVTAPGCAPSAINVVFAGAMRCNSIDPDGSDFAISGPSPVSVTGASGLNCTGGLTTTVVLKLAGPIVHAGTYTVTLVKGGDNNSVISQCAQPTPVLSTVSFTAADTVNAGFAHTEQYVCNQVTIHLLNAGGNGITKWNWTTGSGLTASAPGFTYGDSTFNDQQVGLIVSNGVCSDTASAKFSLNNDYFVKARFEEPSFVCPNDAVTFVDHSMGTIASYDWDFGNGASSLLETPPTQQYPDVVRTRTFPVRLIVENIQGCRDTATRQLKVINNCFIAVPTAFTPNGDGMNDYLYPLNAYKARDLDFRIYNRYGQLVFQTRDWTNKWDGTFQGVPQPTGSYVWMLSYTNTDTGEKVFKKGATLLIR